MIRQWCFFLFCFFLQALGGILIFEIELFFDGSKYFGNIICIQIIILLIAKIKVVQLKSVINIFY